MNQRDKSKELVKSFMPYADCMKFSPMSEMGDAPEFSRLKQLENAKECALLAVDNIMTALKITTGHCTLNHLDLNEVRHDFQYWEDVKTEINKL